MAGKNVICMFLILLVPHYATSVVYGPSLVSLTKYSRDVFGPTIFHPETGRLLHLADYPNFSVIVPLTPDSPTATSNQVLISRRISGPGEFVVQAPEGHGVMAVIQSLDLRVAPSGCNDFIQFGETDGGVETTGTCGKVDNRDGSFTPNTLVGPRVFFSPSGKMRVLFYHGYIWGLVRDFNFDILDPSRNPVLRVEIVFTAYKGCDTPHQPAQLSQSPSSSPAPSYRSCSNTPDRKTCIRSQLFCDRIVNCGFEESFGSDEYVSNCVPSLFNLLLPHVLPIVSRANANTFTSTTTTTSTTTSTTTPKPTTTTASYRSRSSGQKSFTTLIHEQILDIFNSNLSAASTYTVSPVTETTTNAITTRATTPTTTTTTPAPTTSTTTTTTSTSTTTIETPYTSTATSETDEITKTNTETEKLKAAEVDVQEALLKHMHDLDKILNVNMTFHDENTLFAEADEGQVEQLTGLSSSSSSSGSKELDSIESSNIGSFFMWLLISGIALSATFLFLRFFCCNHRVIWVPNPKALRKRRKNGNQNQMEAEFSNQIPEVHVSSNSRRKGSMKNEPLTPPSYDILFPNPKYPDKDFDYLP